MFNESFIRGILELACGSGAFLIQVLNFLIKEHHYIDELSEFTSRYWLCACFLVELNSRLIN